MVWVDVFRVLLPFAVCDLRFAVCGDERMGGCEDEMMRGSMMTR